MKVYFTVYVNPSKVEGYVDILKDSKKFEQIIINNNNIHMWAVINPLNVADEEDIITKLFKVAYVTQATSIVTTKIY